MPNQDISLSAYDPQVAAIQRQQRLAEMLQQQASQDIPITSSGGIQAPISPFQGLAKILQAYGSKKMQDRAEAGMAAYRDKDSASAQALVKQLTMPGYQPGAANTTQLDPTTPQLPGQAAPSPQQPVTLPYANANGQMPVQTLPNQQAQLAMLLGADGGPQTQAVRGAMLPQIMQRQNLDYQHQLGREDADYARSQPMSVAAQQTMDAQGRQSRELAQFKNDLPQTAQEKAALAEQRQYHAEMAARMGAGRLGLSEEDTNALSAGVEAGLIDPARLNSRTAKMYADLYKRNPSLSYVNAAGHAAMVRNPVYQRTIKIAETLPHVLDNMSAAGKKLNYSDVAVIGKFQAFAKGELNDPDFVAYMAQRNDALLTMAQVFRGLGASDKAAEMEEQASRPTMSPRAIDAYINAQKQSLAPRLAEFRKDEIGPNIVQPAAPSFNSLTNPGAAPATNNDPLGLRK